MAVTTAIKRASLDDAWDTAQATSTPLRNVLRSKETEARKLVAGGSLASVSGNSRTSQFSAYGPGQITPLEIVEVWRELIDLLDSARGWLVWCARYGLDPNTAEIDRVQTAPGAPVENPTAVTDADLYEWMMGSGAVSDSTRGWPGKLNPITECRSDYSDMRIGSGRQWT